MSEEMKPPIRLISGRRFQVLRTISLVACAESTFLPFFFSVRIISRESNQRAPSITVATMREDMRSP